jgi:hypothetical protein
LLHAERRLTRERRAGDGGLTTGKLAIAMVGHGQDLLDVTVQQGVRVEPR